MYTIKISQGGDRSFGVQTRVSDVAKNLHLDLMRVERKSPADAPPSAKPAAEED
jgi:hypothetical protein